MKARVPPDALEWRELGAGSAQEMSFDGICPFSVCWIITDGKRRWKYLLINRRKLGIYTGGFHSH